jgi:phage head maturation protease
MVFGKDQDASSVGSRKAQNEKTKKKRMAGQTKLATETRMSKVAKVSAPVLAPATVAAAAEEEQPREKRR